MLDKVKDYFEMEYNDAVELTKNKWKCTTSEQIIDKTLQRCLGVALFVQNVSDVTFEEIDSLYEEYRRKLEELGNV